MKTRKITIKKANKKISLNVERCNFIEKMLGLMVFRNRVLLLFDFKKPKVEAIHSFFCPRFYAVYLDEKNNIIEILKIKSCRIISPLRKFNKLIEVPENKKNEKIINFLDEVSTKK